LTHTDFDDCLNDPDPCISWFGGTGDAYCHHCRVTYPEARAKASHARSSTMEKKNVEQTTTAIPKP